MPFLICVFIMTNNREEKSVFFYYFWNKSVYLLYKKIVNALHFYLDGIQRNWMSNKNI